MTIKHSHIYLASQSQRRPELLKQIGVHYEVLLRNNPCRMMDITEINEVTH